MTAALLDYMSVCGQDGLVAKDLIDWYMTSDHYHPSSGGKTTTAGSDGKEDADGSNEAAAAAAAAEMKTQLLNVLRRMIKSDKSIMAVKSTVKGSKRIEDMLLKKRPQPEPNNNDNVTELKVGAAVVVVAGAGEVSEAETETETEADQVAKLRKQIEEKKASLLAKATTPETSLAVDVSAQEDMVSKQRSQPEVADNDNDLKVSTASAAAVTVTTEALVVSPAAGVAETVAVADTSNIDNLDEQQLLVPVATGEEAKAETETDQVAKLMKQIEDKKASLLAKAATLETEGKDTAKPKATDGAATPPAPAAANATVISKNMKASDYTGKA